MSGRLGALALLWTAGSACSPSSESSIDEHPPQAEALWVGPTPEEIAAQPDPDIVIMMLDTLRPDHLGFMGYERETAPFLAELARESAVFHRAVSTSSWTAPATASALTGLYPHRHGVLLGLLAPSAEASTAGEHRNLSTVWPLKEEVSTLPQSWVDAGRRSFGLSANFNMGRELDLARGFERFERVMGVEAADIEGRLAKWLPQITAAKPPPYLLYLHFNDPHEPYHARGADFSTDGYRGPYAHEKAAYDSEIAYMDAALRRTWEALRAGAKARGRPLITVVVSDHGEGFGEHGSLGHPAVLFREVNRVLWMIHSPELGVVPGERRSLVSLVDLVPTVMELSRLETPQGLDGLSLLPLLRGGEGALEQQRVLSERVVYAHRVDPDRPPIDGERRELWAALQGDKKVIVSPEGVQWMEPWAGDVEAPTPAPAGAEQLLSSLESWRASLPPMSPPQSIELPGSSAESLRALGYVER